jgi:hypothetical protein
VGGSSFNIWESDTGETYAHADPEITLKYLFNKRFNQSRTSSSAFFGSDPEFLNDISTLGPTKPRIAFRDVTNAIDYRTVTAALIPAERFLVNSSPYLLRLRGSEDDEAFILGVLSSVPLDWYARKFVVLHLNLHILNSLPIPKMNRESPSYQRIVSIAAGLVTRAPGTSVWHAAISIPSSAPTTEAQRFEDLCELDAIVGLGYGMTKSDLEHVFSTFHKTWRFEQRLSRVLYFYDKWEKRQDD